MKAIIIFELKRAFVNRAYLLALLVGLGICASHIIFAVLPAAENFHNMYANNIEIPSDPYTIYTVWLLGPRTITQSNLYFFIFPLLISIPFVGSYFTDRNSGYAANVVTRAGAFRYYPAKLMAIFFSAASIAVIPLVIDLFVTALFIPAPMPSFSSGYFTIGPSDLWVSVFYQAPLLYHAMFFALIAGFAGLMGLLGAAFSYVVKHAAFTILAPFAAYAFSSFFFESLGGAWIRYSPEMFIRSDQIVDVDVVALTVAFSVLMIALCTFFFVKIRKDEIY